MLSNSSNTTPKHYRWGRALLLPVWVIASFLLAQVGVVAILAAMSALKVQIPGVNETVLNTIISVIVYAITIAVVILVPLKVKRIHTTKEEVGLVDLPRWMDIFLSVPAFIIYVILTAIVSGLATMVPWYDPNAVQDTGFNNLGANYQYLLAFFSLVVLAPIAEEILFRGYLLGKLKKYVPIWAAVIITSLVFAVAHFSWNVGVDVFALSIVLCSLRIMTGTIWAPILVHMIKNGIAFFILFIAPLLQ